MDANEEVFNPFPGLRPFETDEYNLFFGREGQSDELMARLQRTRFLAVVGTSGSGKSSLIRAGLLPSLYGGLMAGVGSGWRVALLRPGHSPIGNLACELGKAGVLGTEGEDADLQNALIETTLRRSTLGLVDVARQARLGAHENLLVVVDQFEELFRFRGLRETRGTEDEAAAFVKLLLEASQQREVSIYVILTMRSDFLGDCSQFWGLPEAINTGQYLIPRMTRDERREAITGPVAVGGGEIAQSLVNRLLNDMGDSPDQLPILQHALMRTWDEWRDKSPEHGARHTAEGAIDLCCYEAIGGMSNALSRHADEAWAELRDDGERAIAEKLFKALTEKVGDDREIRRPTRLSEICGAAEATPEEVIAVIDVFRREGRSFLMPPAGVELEPNTVIDISHESLIRNWVRLKKWTGEEAQSMRFYTRLADAAAMHAEGQGGHMSDPALQLMLDWREQTRPNPAWASRHPADFASTMSFLDASREHRDAQLAAERERERREIEQTRAFAEQQARSASRLRWASVAMFFLLLLSLGTAGYAFVKRSQAHASAAEAKRLKEAAEQSQKDTSIQFAKYRDVVEAKEEANRAKEAAQAAEEQARAAEKEALDKALKAKARAEREAARANEQARIAARNLVDARQATTAASTLAQSLFSSTKRSILLRQGIEAYRREEFEEALKAFTAMRDELSALQSNVQSRSHQNYTIEHLRQLAAEVSQFKPFSFQLGWALANIGATYQKVEAYEKAIESFEQARAVLEESIPEDSNDPIMFDTYHGLAHSYHAAAKSGVPSPGQVVPSTDRRDEFFTKAEEFFRKALAFQEKHREATPSDAADGYLNLARLYADTDRFDDAEAMFKRMVEIRRAGRGAGNDDDRVSLASALREMGEFYQGQSRYEDAVRVFNEMIILQEEIEVGDLAEQGQELANSYSDLGQIYAAKGDTSKSEGAFRVANLLQRTALKLRRVRKTQPGQNWSALASELTEEFDELGDAYVEIGKFGDAEAIYAEALGLRRVLGGLWKSYDKLTKLYRDHVKDYKKAEEYNKMLVKAHEDDPKGVRYADAVQQLASLALLTNDSNKYSDAEAQLRSALAIRVEQKDWEGENQIRSSLIDLYGKQNNKPALEQEHDRRLAAMNGYFGIYGSGDVGAPELPVRFMAAYLKAVNEAADFYAEQKDNAKAETVYRDAFAKSSIVRAKIFNSEVLDAHASTLEKFIAMLNRLGRPGDAAVIGDAAHNIRNRQREVEQVRQQQYVQQPVQQGPPKATP